MKPQLTLTRAATADLLTIWPVIASDSTTDPDAVLDDLVDASESLAAFPSLGLDRPDIAPGIRYFPHKSYLIIYRPARDGAEVIRYVRAERDLLETLADAI